MTTPATIDEYDTAVAQMRDLICDSCGRGDLPTGRHRHEHCPPPPLPDAARAAIARARALRGRRHA